MMNGDRIHHRLVLHFPGFELTGAEHHYQRFVRECQKFQTVWDIHQDIDPLENSKGVSSWQTSTHSTDWSVSTRIVLMEWASFLNQHPKPTFWRQICGLAPSYFAHFLTSAPWRFFKANWRYGLFFMYPIMVVAAITLFSLAIAWGSSELISELPVPVLAAISLVVFIVTFTKLAPRWKIPLELELFHHTYSMALGQNKIAHSRLAAFSDIIKQEIETSTADEIIITTHSFGSVYATAALAKVLRENPGLLKGKKLTLIAIGSNLLHIGLMKQANWLRNDLELVLAQNNIQWIEVYATNDPICFYKTGPDKVITNPPANSLISRRVRFSRMIDQTRYRHIRGKFFRLHRQLIMANDHRYFFDFYHILFGPNRAVKQLQHDQETTV